MIIETELNAGDRLLLAEATEGFLPAEIVDIHVHVMEPSSYAPATLGPHLNQRTITPESYREAMEMILPGGRLKEALYFPFPARDHDRTAINRWMYGRIAGQGGPVRGRGLAIAGPRDDPGPIAEAMADGRCVGLKPYHLYAKAGDTSQAALEEFAPEWMWRMCDRHGAILMLHLVRTEAVSDAGNREALLRLGAKYPHCQVVLAHVARAFNHRTARGLQALAGLPNMWVDTSAIAESEGIRTAIEILGPGRVIYGSDYPISHLRGRCVTVGNQFLWLYAEESKAPGMTLVGIESLLALRGACRQLNLGRAEIEGIFRGNAQRILAEYRR
ncbi:MAG: kat [Verrucomicrobia bacterium]|nr:kat [Verrucomicrobiota bacterium]